ncbi:MAG: hypothetical protein HA489_03805 [Archaeoglobales archaeon]|nr:hypothetical protein [Archaeoglobales archaeon]
MMTADDFDEFIKKLEIALEPLTERIRLAGLESAIIDIKGNEMELILSFRFQDEETAKAVAELYFRIFKKAGLEVSFEPINGHLDIR